MQSILRIAAKTTTARFAGVSARQFSRPTSTIYWAMRSAAIDDCNHWFSHVDKKCFEDRKCKADDCPCMAKRRQELTNDEDALFMLTEPPWVIQERVDKARILGFTHRKPTIPPEQMGRIIEFVTAKVEREYKDEKETALLELAESKAMRTNFIIICSFGAFALLVISCA